MALVSKSEAARLAGVSRTTIHRYITKGKLSATNGKVDEAELTRVFGYSADTGATPAQGDTLEQGVTQSERVMLRDQIGQLESQVRDIKQERDDWRDRSDQTMELLKNEQENIKLLTDQTRSAGSGNQVTGVIIAVGVTVLTVLGIMYFMGGLS